MAKPVSLSAADLAPAKARAGQHQRGAVPSADLTPMQFRMPPDFALAFRIEAAKRGMKYNELLQECFASFLKAAK
jgi:hypothetical protein